MTPNGSHCSSWSVLTPDPSGERVPGELDARASPTTTPRRCDAHDGDRPDVLLHPRRTHCRADPRQGAASEQATPTTLGIRTRNHASPRIRTRRAGPSVHSHHPIEPSPEPCGIAGGAAVRPRGPVGSGVAADHADRGEWVLDSVLYRWS